MIKKNNFAVIGMPMFLMVSIIVAGVIISIFSLGIYNSLKESKIYEIKKEIEKISSEAENMFEYADEGTLVYVHVNFPSSLKFIVFGCMPQNGVLNPTDYNLNESMSNNYFFVTDDGTISAYSSNARFSSEDISKIALFGPGSYDLKLELVKLGEKSYVKIYK